MNYELKFLPEALKEWKKLDKSVKEQFKKKLKERLKEPKVEADKLKGFEDVYKIKLKALGYRLAYQVKEQELIVLVLKVARRDKIYKSLKESINFK